MLQILHMSGRICDTLYPQSELANSNVFARHTASFEGKQQYTWLGHYATSRKVLNLIPDEATGFLN
jgi:hypothetical protein